MKIIIHTKELEDTNYINILVSPKKHITHHKVKRRYYSAPILDLDYILSLTNRGREPIYIESLLCQLLL